MKNYLNWYEHFKKLKLYIFLNKNLPSKLSLCINEKRLAEWCGTQKSKYKNGTLEEDRREALEEIEQWFWDYDSIWNDKFNELKLFIKENKSLPSRYAKDQKEKALGNWCHNQRTRYKKGKLKEERIKKLEGLDHWVWRKYKKN